MHVKRYRPNRTTVPRVCETCGATFSAPLTEVNRGFGRFCSRSCFSSAVLKKRHAQTPQVGAANPNWKGGKSKAAYPYKVRSVARYPDRHLARKRFEYAVRRGEVVRPMACASCGSLAPVQGHHADYSQPLSVTWLCGPCHRQVHVAA